MFYWSLLEASDCKWAPTNDGYLGCTDTWKKVNPSNCIVTNI